MAWFVAETEQGVALAILRGAIDFKREPWPQISDSAKSLVRQMLEPDPKKRLTAEQVLGKSFVFVSLGSCWLWLSCMSFVINENFMFRLLLFSLCLVMSSQNSSKH